MKKLVAMGLSLAMAFSLTACGSSGSSSGGTTSGASGSTTQAAAASADSGASSGTSTDYPSKNVNGIIQWGAGGGTDSLLRPLSTIAQEESWQVYRNSEHDRCDRFDRNTVRI